jgi:hypothetical protein
VLSKICPTLGSSFSITAKTSAHVCSIRASSLAKSPSLKKNKINVNFSSVQCKIVNRNTDTWSEGWREADGPR